MVELAPIDDPSPTNHLVFDKSLLTPLLGYLSLVKQTAGPIKQLFSIKISPNQETLRNIDNNR